MLSNRNFYVNCWRKACILPPFYSMIAKIDWFPSILLSIVSISFGVFFVRRKDLFCWSLDRLFYA